MRDTQWCDHNQLKQDFQVVIDESIQERVNEVLSQVPSVEQGSRGRIYGLLLYHDNSKLRRCDGGESYA